MRQCSSRHKARWEKVYTSPDILIKLMGLQVLWDVATCLTIFWQWWPKRQLIVLTKNKSLWLSKVLRRILKFMKILGLVPSWFNLCYNTYCCYQRHPLTRLNVGYEKLQGQCYDGASTLSSSKVGVAKRITDLEPRTVYTYCYGHVLETTREERGYKVNQVFPKRDGIFQRLKEALPVGSSRIRVLCPTWWTVLAESIYKHNAIMQFSRKLGERLLKQQRTWRLRWEFKKWEHTPMFAYFWLHAWWD